MLANAKDLLSIRFNMILLYISSRIRNGKGQEAVLFANAKNPLSIRFNTILLYISSRIRNEKWQETVL